MQSFPAIADLSRKHNGRKVSLLVPKELVPLARLHPQVEQIIPFDGDELLHALNNGEYWPDRGLSYLRDLIAEIEILQPDTVVNLTHTSFSAHLCSMIKNATVKGRAYSRETGTVFKGEWSRYFFTLLSDRSCNPYNIVDLFREITDGERVSLPNLNQSGDLPGIISDFSKNNPNKSVIAVGVGANHPLRRWPVERWADTLSNLNQRIEPAIVLLGGANEKETAEVIERALSGQCVNLCGQTDLQQLTTVIEHCDLFLGHDTGPLHLAAMLSKSCVGIYLGMASAWETAPYHQGSIAIAPDIACHPCSESGGCNNPICHNLITPEAVADAALQILITGSKRKHEGCLLRMPEFSTDGRVHLQGERKAGDEKRLLWRSFLDSLLDLSARTLFRPLDEIDPQTLRQWQVDAQQLKSDLLRSAQEAIAELKGGAEMHWYSCEDALTRQIPRLTARYPHFRPLFEMYQSDCRMGNGNQALSMVEQTLEAQEKLLKRIDVVQRILMSIGRKEGQIQPANQGISKAFYSAVTA